MSLNKIKKDKKVKKEKVGVIPNFYTMIEDTSNYINNPKYSDTINHPFRACIIGSSSSKKTNFLLYLISELKVFEKVYIIARQPDEKLYRLLKQCMNKAQPNSCLVSNNFDDLPDLDSMDDTEQRLIVFDDFLQADKQQMKRVQECFIRARKRNCSIVFISQLYGGVGGVNKMIRNNCSHLFLRGLNSMNELKLICREYGLGNNKHEIEDIVKKYKDYTEDGSMFTINFDKQGLDRYSKNI